MALLKSRAQFSIDHLERSILRSLLLVAIVRLRNTVVGLEAGLHTLVVLLCCLDCFLRDVLQIEVLGAGGDLGVLCGLGNHFDVCCCYWLKARSENVDCCVWLKLVLESV